MKPVNLFIVGGPKAGTSSLARYLGDRPDICLANPKEPHFFLGDLRLYRQVSTLQEYNSCFALDSDIKLDASTWYLFSEDAVDNILKYNPKSKFIVMLRHPVDMAISLYYQFKYGFEEEAKTFEEAWDLQSARLKGKYIPKNIVEPLRLQYKDVCSLGWQVKRIISKVPKESLHFIFFDDFINDTRGVYKEVLEFIDCEDDGRLEFPVQNSVKIFKHPSLMKFLRKNAEVNAAVRLVKRIFGIKKFGLNEKIERIDLDKDPKKVVSDHCKSSLVDEFRDDILLLESLLGRDLEHWLNKY